jgi:hypothetical protein
MLWRRMPSLWPIAVEAAKLCIAVTAKVRGETTKAANGFSM